MISLSENVFENIYQENLITYNLAARISGIDLKTTNHILRAYVRLWLGSNDVCILNCKLLEKQSVFFTITFCKRRNFNPALSSLVGSK